MLQDFKKMFGNKISSDNNLQTHWFNLSVECSELGYSETGKCFFLWGGGLTQKFPRGHLPMKARFKNLDSFITQIFLNLGKSFIGK